MEGVSTLDTIYLHVTKACTLRCVYCYFSAGEPFEDELSTEEMLSVLKDACLLGPKRIVFTGGEPLLRKDILQLAQSLRKTGKGIWSCLTTNGTLVNEENAKDLAEVFNEIRISIDCFKEINDALRGEGSFEKALKAFGWVLKAGGNPVAFITVTSSNIHYLKEFMKYLLTNGIVRVHLSPLRLTGRARDDEMLSRFEEIKGTVEEFWHEIFGLQLKIEKKESFNCGVGKFVTVYPDGSVYPCHLLAFPEFCIGNVRKQDLYSIYHQSNLMRKLRNLDFTEISQCAECFKELSSETSCLGALAQQEKVRGKLHKLLRDI